MTLHSEQDAIKQAVEAGKTCEVCGVAICRDPRLSSKQWERRRYCSFVCGGKALNTRLVKPWNKGLKTAEPKQCAVCPITSVRVAFYVGYGDFLCQRHYWHIKKHGRILWGAERPLVTPENYRIRRSKAYAEWRAAVFRRDDYRCMDCGERGGKLQADHIYPFAQFPRLRLDIHNGQTLCERCHKKTPSYLNPHYKAA